MIINPCYFQTKSKKSKHKKKHKKEKKSHKKEKHTVSYSSSDADSESDSDSPVSNQELLQRFVLEANFYSCARNFRKVHESHVFANISRHEPVIASSVYKYHRRKQGLIAKISRHKLV